jgi:hypothetical protein
MDVEQRIEDFERRLKNVELRLSRVEGISAEQGAVWDAPAEDTAAPTFDLAVIGKSLLILGGAFLLRAATDTAAVSKPAGVAIGLIYAIAWIAVAVRQKRRTAGIFYAVTAAIVAYPIVWEAATRFGVLSANMAALVLTLLSIALIEAGRRYAFPSLAWIAATGATCDAILLAFATKALIPFLLALTIVSAVAFVLHAKAAGWLLAIESDLIAILLLILTLLDPASDGRLTAAACLLLFAVICIAVSPRAMIQSAVASLIGIVGSSALILPAPAMTILWGVAALVAAEIARRSSSPSSNITFLVQSAVWGSLAAIGGGLFSFAGAALIQRGEGLTIPLAALGAAALCLIAFLRARSVVLLGIALCGAASMAIYGMSLSIGAASEGVRALVNTTVLAIASIALAAIGRRWDIREASQLAIVLLVLTGAKVVAQDLRTGTAAMMFIALAVYGGAMLAIARIRASSRAVAL